MEVSVCEEREQERKVLGMFSDNEKISGRQMYRAIVVTLAGPTLLICPLVAGRFGADGFFVYLVAGVLSVVYTMLMMWCKNRGIFQCGNNRCTAVMAGLRILLCIKLLFLAIGGLYLICDVVTGILLPETHLFMVLIVLAAALIYWNRGSIESSARAFELIFYWVVVPIVVVIAVAIPKVIAENLIPTVFLKEGGMADKGMDVAGIIKAGVLLWILFSPSELLVFCKEHYRNDTKTTKGVWRGLFMLLAGNVITYGTILGIYGKSGMNRGGTYPLLKVMQISGIPGDFLRRVDGFMSVFLVLSLFCGMVMMMDYLGINLWQLGDMLFGKHERKNKIVYSVVVTGIMVIAVVLIGMKVKSGTADAFMADAYSDKKIISGTELEDRGFVMSVIVGSETVTFEIASDDEGAWQEESEYVTLNDNRVWQAEKLYKENGDKKLDFTHMKVIFVEEDIYESDVTTENLKYMYEKEKFAENVIVCPLSGDIKKMAADAIENGKAFAVVMENILVNSEKSQDMELYRVYLNFD